MLVHLSLQTRSAKGQLRSVPLRFAADPFRGDEYSSPTAAVVNVGRACVIEATEFGDVLVLTGPGHGQYMRWTPERLVYAAERGWYGMSLLYRSSVDDVEDGNFPP